MAITDKGEQIYDTLVTDVFVNSPNVKEYVMCFVSEMDRLFEELENVYYGRLIDDAVGVQLDWIGNILNRSRAIPLPRISFGFVGASNVDGFSDEAAPAVGGTFFGEGDAGFDVTPLADDEYRRVLKSIAFIAASQTNDINTVYKSIAIVLGRVPQTFEIVATGNDRSMRLDFAISEVSSTESLLVQYMTRYFVPVGTELIIDRV